MSCLRFYHFGLSSFNFHLKLYQEKLNCKAFSIPSYDTIRDLYNKQECWDGSSRTNKFSSVDLLSCCTNIHTLSCRIIYTYFTTYSQIWESLMFESMMLYVRAVQFSVTASQSHISPIHSSPVTPASTTKCYIIKYKFLFHINILSKTDQFHHNSA